ncbi:MAG: hypothetical protein ABJ251_22460 [Paracoccaceae bacterium]
MRRRFHLAKIALHRFRKPKPAHFEPCGSKRGVSGYVCIPTGQIDFAAPKRLRAVFGHPDQTGRNAFASVIHTNGYVFDMQMAAG